MKKVRSPRQAKLVTGNQGTRFGVKTYKIDPRVGAPILNSQKIEKPVGDLDGLSSGSGLDDYSLDVMSLD